MKIKWILFWFLVAAVLITFLNLPKSKVLAAQAEKPKLRILYCPHALPLAEFGKMTPPEKAAKVAEREAGEVKFAQKVIDPKYVIYVPEKKKRKVK